MRKTLKFEIQGFWHAGTGRGAGAELDAVVIRTAEGLPLLPGRTVKGLLRDAVDLAEQTTGVGAGTAVRLFGTDVERKGENKGKRGEREKALEEARFTTEAGQLAVGSAELGLGEAREQWRKWAASKEGGAAAERLFRPFASTKIDDRGVAANKTLRAIELAVPMTLFAEVTGPDDAPWVEAVRTACAYIDALGSHRNRGLGRVVVTLEDSP